MQRRALLPVRCENGLVNRTLRFLVCSGLIAAVLGGCGSQKDAPERQVTRTTESRGQKQPPAAPESDGMPTPAEQSAALRRFAAKGRPIYCGGRSKPWVALTFDDGPGPYSKHVLALLNRYDAARTFFFVGRNVQPFRSSLERAKKSGAAIGNHSWSHPVMPSLAASQQREQLQDTSRSIKRVTGTSVRIFRPPYAERDAATDRASRRLGMATILWDVDSRDALGASSKEIARRVRRGLHPGAIVLLHENRGQTVRALRYTILPALKRSGLATVTVPQMLAGNPPSADQLARGRSGCLGRG